MKCVAVQQAWFASKLGIHVPNIDLKSWLLSWFSCPDQLAKQVFCITIWKIWKCRNQTVFNKLGFQPIQVAEDAASFVEEYNLANKSAPKASILAQPSHWEPPDADFLKIIVDAGCFSNGYTGWGLICRNNAGIVQVAATKLEKIQVSLSLAEALGLRWCLQWAKENLIVECDAEHVVKCLIGVSKAAELESIILDCIS